MSSNKSLKEDSTKKNHSSKEEVNSKTQEQKDVSIEPKQQNGENSTASKNTFGLSKLLDLLKLLGIIGSGTVIVLTAVRAHFFSNYYGIPAAELIDINITGELIVQVIPPFFLFALIALEFLIAKSSNTQSKYRVFTIIFIEISLLFIGALNAVLMFIYGLDIYNKLGHGKCSIFLFGLIIALLLISFLGSLIMFPVYQRIKIKINNSTSSCENKRMKTVENLIVILFTTVGVTYFICVMLPFGLNILDTYTNVEHETTYEITTTMDAQEKVCEYATISSNGNGRLVMECEIDHDANQLTLKYGHYKYLKTDDNDFECITFNSVICDNPNISTTNESVTESADDSTNESASEG